MRNATDVALRTSPSEASSTRALRVLLVLVIFVLPAAYALRQALWNPAIEFLVPTPGASWVLQHGQKIESSVWGAVFRDVAFVRTFRVETPPPELVLRIRAFDAMRVELNGRVLKPLERITSWKRSSRFDLGPELVAGDNRLLVRVSNRGALPALVVEEPRALRTPDSWESSLGPRFDDPHPVVGPTQRPTPGPLQVWAGWVWARWVTALWLAAVSALGLWCAIRLVRGGSPQPAGRRRPSSWVAVVAPASILALSLGLQLSNAARYPADHSPFDAPGHVRYVERMASQWLPPSPTEGFVMYHPPLYYWIAGGAYRAAGGLADSGRGIKAAQYVGALSIVGLSIVSWLLARRFFPGDVPAQCVVVGFSAFLPMCLYMGPLLGNESLAALLIAGVTWGLSRWSAEPPPLVQLAALGALTGLALLAKFTGVFVFAAGLGLLGLRALARRRLPDWRALAAYAGVVALVCGWFYARNVRDFGDPFVGNWDLETGMKFEDYPTYRSAGFYLRFGSVFFSDLQNAPALSWLDGVYASMYADAFGSFHPPWQTGASFSMSVAVILAALPSLAILLGLLEALASALRRPAFNVDFLLLALPVWMYGAQIVYSMEIPTASTQKAFYAISLVPILGIHLARGRRTLDRYVPGAHVVLDVTLVLLALLSISTYRIGSTL